MCSITYIVPGNTHTSVVTVMDLYLNTLIHNLQANGCTVLAVAAV